ncbi:hypothetical protein A0J61_10333 [Choanephora cucurbitarum]|uniref:Uncharacterized protein n=1 Tax=Choanephora cucurbitarum TaxID=101091 RepID=A0A1C7MXQ1_9FUNG|nr:hypothetical protein A0J61_10333 [Choanephora cucurbitarum]
MQTFIQEARLFMELNLKELLADVIDISPQDIELIMKKRKFSITVDYILATEKSVLAQIALVKSGGGVNDPCIAVITRLA